MTHVETTTSYGALRGQTENGLSVFRGIPFAAPPVGPLRFEPPQPPATWDGVRDALEPGNASVQPQMQAAGLFGRAFGTAGLEVSEDCLYLNVWTPACDDKKRPVMVWIHGGGFNMGTGATPMYTGEHLAKRGDVVVVSINYRLGILGFFWKPGFNEANAGMADQAAALRWVKSEIANFGGDPGNVTIFGESAGGKSVECLLAMPSAKGLFHKAVLESTYAPSMDPAGAVERADLILQELGIAEGDVERIRDVPLDELLQATGRAQAALMARATAGGVPAGTAPVVDGTVIPEHPLDAIAGGAVQDVPLIVGTTADESRLFTMFMPGADQLEEDKLPERVKGSLPGADEATIARAIEVYKASLAERGSPNSPADVAAAAQTDRMFRQHSIKVAEAQHAAGGAVYMYLFDWLSTGFDGRLRACHGLEIPFVFGTLDSPMGEVAGDGEQARALSEQVMDAWLAFARDGMPQAAGLPEWPAFDTDRRATMVLDAKARIADAPLETERELWASLPEWR